MSSDKKQFESGWQPDVSFQDGPGLQKDMPHPPSETHLPTPEGGYQAYKPAGKLQGKRAIITGGDSGIGRAAAIMFAMEGASHVAIAYLPAEERDAQNAKKLVEEHGAKAHLFATDLVSSDNCKKVVEESVKLMGGVDILFNNHATQTAQDSILDIPEEQWINTFNTNMHPFFFLSKYALPHMGKGSTIINNASINAYVGRPDLLDYTSSKGAIVAFTRGLSNQFVAKGIRVNAIAPGPVWTPLIPATMTREMQEGFTAPMGRPSQPSEMATVVVFLASLDSSSISGQTIHANGGTVVNG